MTASFTIGILETGRPPESLAGDFQPYPKMFEALLQPEVPEGWAFKSYAALDGDLPEASDSCDAWLITGSKFGAYEDYDWIHRLRAFLAQAYADGVPVIGICFGHQLLAEALGGKVIKSDKGWGCGTHSYDWAHKPDWLSEEDGERFAIQAYHQDQVVALPKDAEVLASSDFCDYAVLAYGNQALTFQGHPEFGADYSAALFKERRGVSLPEDVADEAIATLDQPMDRHAMGRGIVEFLKAYQAR